MQCEKTKIFLYIYIYINIEHIEYVAACLNSMCGGHKGDRRATPPSPPPSPPHPPSYLSICLCIYYVFIYIQEILLLENVQKQDSWGNTGSSSIYLFLQHYINLFWNLLWPYWQRARLLSFFKLKKKSVSIRKLKNTKGTVTFHQKIELSKIFFKNMFQKYISKIFF